MIYRVRLVEIFVLVGLLSFLLLGVKVLADEFLSEDETSVALDEPLTDEKTSDDESKLIELPGNVQAVLVKRDPSQSVEIQEKTDAKLELETENKSDRDTADHSISKPKNQLSDPSHIQLHLLAPKHEGKSVRVETFCLDPDGNLFVVPSARLGDVGVLVVTPDGDEIAAYDVPFQPTAIALAPDRSIFVAGGGNIAHLSSNGELLAEAKTPIPTSGEEIVQKELERRKKEKRLRAENSLQQIDRLEERVAALKEEIKEAGEEGELKNRLSVDRAKHMLKAYEKYLEQMRASANTPDEEQNEEKEVSLSAVEREQLLRQLKANLLSITSIAANNSEVFVTTSGDSGYAVWRFTYQLSDPKKIMDGLAGCCGQMDVRCDNDRLVIAENCSYKVGIYNREGKRVDRFGKQDSQCKTGFGGCCNPMNALPLADGGVLTAESSIGHIKRFDQTGKFVSYIGRAKIGGGCKHCPLGFDPQRDLYYMLYEDTGKICVLGSIKKNADLASNREKQRAEATKRLLGTWKRDGSEPDPEDPKPSGSSLFDTCTFQKDGGANGTGHLFDSIIPGEGFRLEWAWSNDVEFDGASKKLTQSVSVSLQVARRNFWSFEIQFVGPNRAKMRRQGSMFDNFTDPEGVAPKADFIEMTKILGPDGEPIEEAEEN